MGCRQSRRGDKEIDDFAVESIRYRKRSSKSAGGRCSKKSSKKSVKSFGSAQSSDSANPATDHCQVADQQTSDPAAVSASKTLPPSSASSLSSSSSKKRKMKKSKKNKNKNKGDKNINNEQQQQQQHSSPQQQYGGGAHYNSNNGVPLSADLSNAPGIEPKRFGNSNNSNSSNNGNNGNSNAGGHIFPVWDANYNEPCCCVNRDVAAEAPSQQASPDAAHHHNPQEVGGGGGGGVGGGGGGGVGGGGGGGGGGGDRRPSSTSASSAVVRLCRRCSQTITGVQNNKRGSSASSNQAATNTNTNTNANTATNNRHQNVESSPGPDGGGGDGCGGGGGAVLPGGGGGGKETKEFRIAAIANLLALAALDLSAPATSLLVKNRKNAWIQLAGHPGAFAPAGPNSIWKKRIAKENYETLAYQALSDYPQSSDIIPSFHREVEFNGEYFIEMEDLLHHFNDPSIMDIKMGTRTFLEAEVKNPVLRKDLFEKMVKLDPNAPTDEEKEKEAITKLRYMQFREHESSTASLGFRIEAIRMSGEPPNTNLKKVKNREQVSYFIQTFTKGHSCVIPALRDRLRNIRTNFESIPFFKSHEIIGSSLLIMYDSSNHSGAWMIDFAKTIPVPDLSLNHRSPWQLGNHEDGYLCGLDHLIEIFDDLASEVEKDAAKEDVEKASS